MSLSGYRYFCWLLLCLLGCPILYAQSGSTPHMPVKHVLAMAEDHAGNIWVGAEDQQYPGLLVYNPQTKWRKYTTADGMGDNYAYAIAVDTLGRIWVGHLNHGVSVYNGSTWQNYDQVAGLSRPDSLAGPLGERVFDIKISPLDGDVWIASSLGLARYSIGRDDWRYYTRADGVPSDQFNALAFAPDGTLYGATQADGVAIAHAEDDYAAWKHVPGPEKMPLHDRGEGLASTYTNDVLVARDGTVYVATIHGLSYSRDAGQSWHYLRGRDYGRKVQGLYKGPPDDWHYPSDELLDRLLMEDYAPAWPRMRRECSGWATARRGMKCWMRT
jgi:ligand-binding sensor domain-containing protein